MATEQLYTVAQATHLTAISKAAIRAYTRREDYRRFLSTESTPEMGGERRFTPSDLRLLRFIYEHTARGESHEEVGRRLAAGELERFEWWPSEEPKHPGEPEGEQTTALVPLEQLRAIQTLLADARQREEAARSREDALQKRLSQREQELQDQIRLLERELGKTQGELESVKAYQRKPPKWWVRLFGGRETE